jgi:ankyrin repeat protein
MNKLSSIIMTSFMGAMAIISLQSYSMEHPNGLSDKAISLLEQFAKTYSYPLEDLHELINIPNLSKFNRAALEGDITTVESLRGIQPDSDFTLGNKGGISALALAFIGNQFEIVKLLLEHNHITYWDLLFIWHALKNGPDDETIIINVLKCRLPLDKFRLPSDTTSLLAKK